MYKEGDLGPDFPSNEISTTKYNVFSFLPKFLHEQFRRATNVFGFTAILHLVLGLAPEGEQVVMESGNRNFGLFLLVAHHIKGSHIKLPLRKKCNLVIFLVL